MKWLVCAWLAVASAAWGIAPLDTNPADYFVLGMKSVRLKNLIVAQPGCNVGVNCPNLPARCGTMKMKDAVVPGPGQVVGANVCGPGSFFEVFRNNSGCDPGCSMIASPGASADCTQTWTPSILGDLDGDTEDSCALGCVIDYDDVALACGQTLPLPACDPLHTVTAVLNADCGTDDIQLGNAQCDLGPGAYGKITVQAGATLAFHAGVGDTVACGLTAGTASRVLNVGDVVLKVPGKGHVRLNNDGQHGGGCGSFEIVTFDGRINLGKRNDIDLDACAVSGKLHLGHDSSLRGHFVGEQIVSDIGNVGRCCGNLGSSVNAAFTETSFFYETQPAIVQSILTGAGGTITACGRTLTNLNYSDGHSLLEALCTDEGDDPRVLLARELTTVALTAAAGGATFGDLALCDARCQNNGTPLADLLDCIGRARKFNFSGAHQPFPLPAAAPSVATCSGARNNGCNIYFTSGCATP